MTTNDQDDAGIGDAETLAVSPNPDGAASAAASTPGDDEPSLKRGDKLGRYMIVGELGRGGMGVVYNAFDPELDRKIALKVVRPRGEGTVDQGERRARLQREAQAMAKLSHPNVIHVYDVGTVGEQVFIAMELVDGPKLSTWAKQKHGWRETLEVFQAAGTGLVAAHAAGVIHRDFKPDNVLVGSDRVRVLDFGLARAVTSEHEPEPSPAAVGESGARPLDDRLTETGYLLGTPAYMAPEQHAGKPADERSDQFAFCVALWEALFQTRPFKGTTAERLAENMMAGNLTEPPRSRVPDSVVRTLERGLSVDPAKRFGSMRLLLHGLEVAPSRAGRRLAIAAAALLVVGGAVGLGVRSYRNRVVIEHYAAFTEIAGKPRGIGPLDSTARSHRQFHWRMKHRRGRVLELHRVDATGRLAPDDTGGASWWYLYAGGDTLREIVSRDARGRVVMRLRVSPDQKRLERRDDRDNPLPFDETDASVVLRDFDDAGHTVRERYANAYGEPRPDVGGAYGYQTIIGAEGLPIEWVALGADGQPTATAGGIARVTRTYDEHGNVTSEHYFGPEGGPTLSEDQVAGIRYGYDRWGNRVEAVSLDLQDQPGTNRFGYAIQRTSHDDRGRPIAVDYQDAAGAAVQPRGGMASRRSYDGRGNLLELGFVNTTGEPAPNVHGVAFIRNTYDERDQLTSRATFDAQRRPTLDTDGSASIRYAYDERGHRVEIHYFDATGEPVYIKDGYSRYRAVYDERDNLIEEHYLAPQGNPIRLPAGYSTVKATYDERGRRVQETYYDPVDRPTLSSAGFATTRTTYDQQSNPLEIAYFDTAGNPAIIEEGYAREVSTIDARGNLVETRYFDADGQLTTIKRGYAIWKREYDGRGQEISSSFLGRDELPVRDIDGIAGYRRELDERG
ncbi:MAG TPA: protein kinase, partial [Kofleriaceae bacterium]|nr:protein kinase [Kofleriaceae bacterium]